MDSRTTPAATWTPATQALPKRDVWQAMARGLRCRCPNCGEGKIFRAFLKVTDKCSVCGENLSHHRADDLPAYLVIVIVGHIIVPIALPAASLGSHAAFCAALPAASRNSVARNTDDENGTGAMTRPSSSATTQSSR